MIDATHYVRDLETMGKGPRAAIVAIGCVRSALDAFDMGHLWHFWNDRDLRTLLALYPEAKLLPFEGTKHHALDDAMHEAKQLLAALQLHHTLAGEALA